MRRSQYWYGVLIGFLALIATSSSYAATATKPSRSTVRAAKTSAPSAATITAKGGAANSSSTGASKVFGLIDLRPGYVPNGKFISENTFRLGYQFNPNFQILTEQYVNHHLYNPASGEDDTPGMYDGYVGAKFNNIWTNESQGLSLAYSPRAYLPTSKSSQNAGLITFIRQNFVLRKKVSDTLTLSVAEIPLVFIYNQSGYVGDNGPTANPIFQNRVYFIADVNIAKNLTFSFPLMFFQTKSMEYAGAKNSGAWSLSTYIWPELDYAINENVSVGIAYYNLTSLFTSEWKQQFSKAIQTGVYQVAFMYNL